MPQPQFVGVDIDEAEEFTQSDTATPVKNQGQQRNAARQEHVLRLLGEMGRTGATAKDATQYLVTNFDPQEYHGPVSSTINAMWNAGLIARLAHEKRNRFGVYVLPEHVAGREIIEPEKKESPMLGLRTKPSPDAAKIEGLANENARLKEELEAREAHRLELNQKVFDANAERDNALERMNNALTAAKEANRRADKENRRAEEMEGRYDSLTVRVADLEQDVARQRDILSEKNREIGELRAQNDEAEQMLAVAGEQVVLQAPRKTLTADEQNTLEAVARVLAKFPSDGTPDKPTRIPVKASTLRSLGRALQRVTGD